MPRGSRNGRRRRSRQSGPGEHQVGSQERSPKEQMLSEMRSHGYNGRHFADNLETSVANQRKRGKSAKRNRYIHYCNWAHALLRQEIGPPEAEFSFPSSVLAFIRFLVPGDVKGELREDAYKVTMVEFCTAMELPDATEGH